MLIAAATVASPAAASGATSNPPAPSMTPVAPGPDGYFEYSLGPGRSQQGSVTVRNPSQQSATFSIYPVDGLTSSASGVVYSGYGAATTSTGSWVVPADRTLTLGPGASRQVGFTVTVPAAVAPGQHIGGLAAQDVQAGSAQGSTGGGQAVGFNLSVTTRVVIAVVVTVPGPAHAGLSIGSPGIQSQNGVRQVVAIPMTVTGGLLIKPGIALGVETCRGREVVHSTRQLDTMVPATSILYTWSLGGTVLSAGCYRISVAASLDGTTLASVSGTSVVSATTASVSPRGGGAGPGPAAVTPPALRSSGTPAVAVAGASVGGALLLAFAVMLYLRSRRRRRQLEEQVARLSSLVGPDRAP